MLSLQNVQFHWGPQPVLAGVSLYVGRGEKVGLAGANGAGKSTLLQIAAGGLAPDTGTVNRPKLVGYLAQEPEIPDGFSVDVAVRDVVVSSSPTAALARRLAVAESRLSSTAGNELNAAIEEYGRLEEAYREEGGYRVEADAATVLAGLGLGGVGLDQPIGPLSAGERTRLEMARVLVSGADLLLLDEPTNHLDADGTRWLMQFLARSETAVLLVSHDLRLLDHAISRVYELDAQARTIEEFTGTYSDYLQWSKHRGEVLRRTRRRQLAEADRLQETADRFRTGTEKSARRAKVLDRRIERMRSAAVDVPAEARTLGLHFGTAPRSGRTVLSVAEVQKSYGAKEVLRGVGFDLERGERLTVIGANGAGKSTLLSILAGRLEPDAGSSAVGHNVDLGYFAHRFSQRDGALTAYDYVRKIVPGDEATVRGALARLLLGEDHVFRPLRTLSAGERARLGIAQLMLEHHNLLVLDEPNSNLDAQTREWLLGAFDEYRASLIVVSHDRAFVEGLRPDRVLLMPDEAFAQFETGHLDRVEVQ